MSLAMISRGASYEFRWRRWALLRDVVATHLEGAVTGSRFKHFASIGRALGAGGIQIPAAELATELRQLREALAAHPTDDLVLGPITAKVLYPTLNIDQARPLTRTELSHIAPIVDEKTLDQYFASMIDSMLEVCGAAGEGANVEVIDG